MRERIAIWLGGSYPTNGSIVITVVEHIMLTNWWEYFVMKEPGYESGDDIQWCFGMGVANEYGTFSRKELKEANGVMSQTRELSEIMPPEGFAWLDQAVEDGDVDEDVAKQLIEREQDRHNPVTVWCKNNHEMIDKYILDQVPNYNPNNIDADERYSWVWNDETLYNMAQNDGVSFE